MSSRANPTRTDIPSGTNLNAKVKWTRRGLARDLRKWMGNEEKKPLRIKVLISAFVGGCSCSKLILLFGDQQRRGSLLRRDDIRQGLRLEIRGFGMTPRNGSRENPTFVGMTFDRVLIWICYASQYLLLEEQHSNSPFRGRINERLTSSHPWKKTNSTTPPNSII